MTLDEDMARVWRQFAARLAIALATGAVTFLIVGMYFMQAQRSQDAEISHLRDQVAASDRQVECRSRITNAAEMVRADRDSLGWQSLVDRIVLGNAVDVTARAKQMADLNQRLLDATALRSKSIELCAANPDFTPN